jgi:hypothetical protein
VVPVDDAQRLFLPPHRIFVGQPAFGEVGRREAGRGGDRRVRQRGGGDQVSGALGQPAVGVRRGGGLQRVGQPQVEAAALQVGHVLAQGRAQQAWANW